VRHCSTCFLLTEEDPCPLCRDASRDRSVMCVVEDPLNAWRSRPPASSAASTTSWAARLDPLHGIGPEELTVSALVGRVREGSVREIILATNPTVEGEATAHYLARALRATGISVTRIAFGLPAGGEISYAIK